jgi:hypothetical protein
LAVAFHRGYPVRRHHNHRRAAALGGTRQAQRNARWHRRRAGAEVDDNQAEAPRLEDQFSRLEDSGRPGAATPVKYHPKFPPLYHLKFPPPGYSGLVGGV